MNRGEHYRAAEILLEMADEPYAPQSPAPPPSALVAKALVHATLASCVSRVENDALDLALNND